MEGLVEKIEAIIDDIETDDQLTKNDILSYLYELKQEIEDEHFLNDRPTINWEDLDP